MPIEQGPGFDMVRCPVADCFRMHGSGGVAVGTWCSLDDAIAETIRCRLVPPQTLAVGAPRRDFFWLLVEAWARHES